VTEVVTSLGFRRRCAWCGVQLRGWQLNLCRLCGPRAKGSAGIYLSAGGPPCAQGSRWDATPDGWFSGPRPRGVMNNRIDSCGCVWKDGEVVEECAFHAGRTP
jgi:hypothetical protein